MPWRGIFCICKLSHVLAYTLFFLLTFVTLFALSGAQNSEAAPGINKQIPFYGSLKTSTGTVVADGNYDMVVRIYTATSGGSTLWTGTHTAGNGNAVEVTNGNFNILLGSGSGNLLDLDFNDDSYYLGLTIGSDSEMTPRQRIGAAGYAINSDTVDGLDAEDFLRSNATTSLATSSTETLLTITQSGAGDILNLFDGGTEVLSVLDGGNVGIGTTSPWKTLSVVGDLSVTGAFFDSASTSGLSGQLLMSTATGTAWVSTSTLGLGSGGSASGTVNTGTTGQIAFYASDGSVISGTSSLYINADGNIGIGTTSPQNKLTIGTFATSDTQSLIQIDGPVNSNQGLLLRAPSSQWVIGAGTLQTTQNGIGFEDQDNSTVPFWVEDTASNNAIYITDISPVGLPSTIGSSVGIGTSTPLAKMQILSTAAIDAFRVDDVLGDTTPFVIDEDGNVGIGTSTPNDKLHVWGDLRVGTSTNEITPALFVDASNSHVAIGATSSDDAQLIVRGVDEDGIVRIDTTAIDNGNADALLIFSESGNDRWYVANQGNQSDVFSIFDVDDGESRLAITQTGNVGIGTTTPPNALTVNNAITGQARFYGYNGLGATAAADVNSGQIFFGGAAGSAIAGSIGYSGSNRDLYIANLDTSGTNRDIVFLNDSTELVRFESEGNVGIGTTSPWKTLSVVGDLSITGAFFDSASTSGNVGQILMSTASGTEWTSTSTLGLGGGGSGTVNTGVQGQIGYYAAGGTTLSGISSTTIFVTPTDQISIGSSTPSNTTIPLIVSANGSANSALFGGTQHNNSIRISRTGVSDSYLELQSYTDSAGIEFEGNRFTIDDEGNERLRIDNEGDIAIGTTTSVARLTLQATSTSDILNLFETGGQEVFTVLENGNVGIGTTTPTSLLTLRGDTDGLTLYDGTNRLSARLDVASTEDGRLQLYERGSNTIMLHSGTGEISYINNNGSFGIGTTTPEYDLVVDGSFQLTGAFFDGASTSGNVGQVLMSTATGTEWVSTSSSALGLGGGGVADGNDDHYGPTIFVAASDTASSGRAHYVADGTNDEEQIQNAIDALPVGGGTVYLLEGTFILGTTTYSDRSINPATNTRLVGTGNGTVLQLASGHDNSVNIIEAENVSGVHIADLQIDGNEGAQAAASYFGIYFNVVASSTIQNVTIHDVEDIAILDTGGSGNTIINNDIFDNATGISITSSDAVVNHNAVRDNSGTGIIAGGSAGTYTGNTSEDNTTGISSSNHQNSITSNSVRNNSGDGISITGDSNTVVGNTAFGNGGIGITVSTAAFGVAITGNNVNTNSSHGIFIGADHPVVSANTISSNTGSGIFLSSATDALVADNNLYDNAGGAGTDNIRLLTSDDAQISGNRIIDTAGSGYAIEIDSGSNNTMLANNYYSGTGASQIDDNGTNTQYTSNNRLSLTANSTLYQDGAYTAFTVTHAGTGNLLELQDADGVSTTTVVTVLNNGFVGIGTTSPDELLVLHQSGNSSTTYMNFTNGDTGSTGNDGLQIGISGGETGYVWNYENRGLEFGTNDITRMTIAAGGQVGIGTTSPWKTLSVVGDMSLSGAFFDSASTSGNVGQILMSTATGTAWVSTSSNALNLGTGGGGGGSGTVNSGTTGQVAFYESGGTAVSGTSSLFIAANGNIGIGTTTPSNQLDIWGNLRVGTTTLEAFPALYVDSTNFHVGIGATSSDDAQLVVRGIDEDAVLRIDTLQSDTSRSDVALALAEGGNDSWYIGNQGSGDDSFYVYDVNDTETRLTISQNGNLGIGTTTPASLLDVWGDVQIGTTTANPTLFVDVSLNRVDAGGTIRANADYPLMSYWAQNSNLPAIEFDGNDGIWYNQSSNQFDFLIGGSTELSLDTTGLGIGTSSPTSKLHVHGNTLLDGALLTLASTSASALQIDYSVGATSTIPDDTYFAWTIATSTTDNPIIRIETDSTASGGATTSIRGGFSVNSGSILHRYDSGITSIDNLELGALAFESDAGVVSWVDLSISTSTATGTVQSYTAQIDSTTVLTIYGEADGQGNATSTRVGVGTTSPNAELDVLGTIRSTNLLGGATTLSTDASGNIIRTPSDLKLKTNVATITDALPKLLALRGVSYDWVDTARFGTTTELGFIAQEVDLILPEIVKKGGEYISLNTPNMLAIVIEAMKEMWNKVTGNTTRIELLEAENEELKSRLDAVESSLGATSTPEIPEEPEDDDPAPDNSGTGGGGGTPPEPEEETSTSTEESTATSTGESEENEGTSSSTPSEIPEDTENNEETSDIIEENEVPEIGEEGSDEIEEIPEEEPIEEETPLEEPVVVEETEEPEGEEEPTE